MGISFLYKNAGEDPLDVLVIKKSREILGEGGGGGGRVLY